MGHTVDTQKANYRQMEQTSYMPQNADTLNFSIRFSVLGQYEPESSDIACISAFVE